MTVSGQARGRAEVLPTHTPDLFARAVAHAADCLKRGEVIALPTETVYGLAANALDPRAVRRIYEIKGRPETNPVIVHVASASLARACVRDWTAPADRLARAFWPGPLTLVLEKADSIPEVVTAGGHTVGVRWPAHPLMQAVIRACGFPIAAPSANRANGISPTCAAHVVESLGEGLDWVIDGGPSSVGIESTVVDLVARPPRVLRPGMIHGESLAAALGELVQTTAGAAPHAGAEGESGSPRRSPGLLTRHYAPAARLVVLEWSTDGELARGMERAGVDAARAHVLAYHVIPAATLAARVCVIPHDPEAYARAMYAEWHRCDAEGARWIVVEAVPGGREWAGVADRLTRASAR
ncbi:MAG: threonylcarbamoyl-AMP synthase [Verrucomicrobiales bacterium]|nr:threonylcarbamoyl-AMP synthase [Verrucomicrobiales bacterium]